MRKPRRVPTDGAIPYPWSETWVIGTRASAKPPHRVVTEGLPSTTPLSVAHLMQPGRIDALTGVRTTQQL